MTKPRKTFSGSFVYACGVFSIFMFCAWLFCSIALFLLLPLYAEGSPTFVGSLILCEFLWLFSFIASLTFTGSSISFYDDKVTLQTLWYFKKEIAISDIDYYRIDLIRILVLTVKGKVLRVSLMLPRSTLGEAEEYLKSIGIKK